MKPLLFHNPKDSEHSFYIQEDNVPHFYDLLHFHPEYQVTVIINAHGTLTVNDYSGQFKTGDIFIIGSSVPHVFRSADEYYTAKPHPNAHSMSIYFREDSFGDGFFNLPENKPLLSLLKGSVNGIRIKPADLPEARKTIVSMKKMKGVPRLVAFLTLLHDMAKADKRELSLAVPLRVKDEKNERLTPVLKYVIEHFAENVSLKKAAELSHLSVPAFCRFFKRKTRKTFSEAVRDTRIANACKLLQDAKLNIQQVAYKSGYNNLSNFNRQFFQVIKLTPSEYVKRYSK